MMRPSDELPLVYLYTEPIDFRKHIDGLAMLVEHTLELNPFSEHLFAFVNRRRDKVKILYWEKSGFVLWYKRLEKQRFHWPRHLGRGTVTLSGQQLNFLLDGFNLAQWRPHEALFYRSVL